MGCLLPWHFRRDNKTYWKEEEGTDCKETKLGKYFDCRGSWLVKGFLSVYNTVYFPFNFGYWIARQLWRRLPSRRDCFYVPLSYCRITIKRALNQSKALKGRVASSRVHISQTYTLPFCVKGICACDFLILEKEYVLSMQWAKGRASNIASQHRGTSVGKGDFELPAAISRQNYKKKKKKTLDTPYAALQGERMSRVSDTHTIMPTHFSTTMQ